MKRLLSRIAAVSVALVLVAPTTVSATTAPEPAGDPSSRACADFANPADNTVRPTAVGYLANPDGNGGTVGQVSARLSFEAATCAKFTYSVHVYGVDAHNAPTTELGVFSQKGDGVSRSLFFRNDTVPGSPNTICVFLTSKNAHGRVADSAPTQKARSAAPVCVAFVIGTAPGFNFA